MDAPLVHQLSRQWHSWAAMCGTDTLKASKREAALKIRSPLRPLVDYEVDRSDV